MPDLFRDTKVRYLGYANEVGESFRGVVPPKVVRWSYGVAGAYVLADTADKTWKMLRKEGRPIKALIAGTDALIWQTLASIVIPGLTINRICAYTGRALAKQKKIPVPARKALTVAAGLISIPIIVTPIDKTVHLFMDLTIRWWFKV